MTLGELITALEQADQSMIVPVGFGHPHSYRGIYEDLAFEPRARVPVARMLRVARSALGATFEGYKGGGFVMDAYTRVWLARFGHGGGETIGPILLSYMLGQPKMPKASR